MEQKPGKGMYDLQLLRSMNNPRDFMRKITQEDVLKVNKLVEHIKNTRCNTTPKFGDTIMYTSKHGDFFSKSMIGDPTDIGLSISMNCFCVPVVTPVKDGVESNSLIGFSTYVPKNKVKYIGTTERLFQTRGNTKINYIDSLYFKAEVNLWEYEEPDQLYGEFTSRHWRKIYFYKTELGEECLYYSKSLTFQSEETFERFLKNYHATKFEGLYEGQIVVFCYYDILKEVPADEWEKLNAPIQTRTIWDKPTKVKMCKDDAKHQIINVVSKNN